MIYACSDIHGQYEMFKKMLKKIDFTPNDEMYIIGDVVDRGPQPINTLLYIMEKDNIHMLIGNHEHMMLESQTNPLMIGTWYLNGAQSTDEQLDLVGHIVKKRILDWLMKQPLIIPNIEVNQKHFYLAHASHALCPIDKPLLYKDAGRQMINQVTWSREYKNPDKEKLNFMYQGLYKHYKGYTLICGHTPTYKCNYGHKTTYGAGRISKSMSGHLINLDCGCVRGRALGCLCLDTLKEFYVDGKKTR